MPLQTSGQITLLNIRDQFGAGAAPHGLGEYYAGGAYVLPGTQGINGAIPSTVGDPIRISDFYGAPTGTYIYNFNLTIGFYSYSDTLGSGTYGEYYGYNTTLPTSIGSISGDYVTLYGTINGLYSSSTTTSMGTIERTRLTGLTGVPNGSSLVIGAPINQTLTWPLADPLGWSGHLLVALTNTVVPCTLTTTG